MKLRNKKTGEIMPASNIAVGIGEDGKWYDNISELTDEWEDYKEPKTYWHLNEDGHPYASRNTSDYKREIGNHFETKEEAEKAVEKLKAWKRLRDKGFKFVNVVYDEEYGIADIRLQTEIDPMCLNESVNKDINLAFGGEE